jgi:hypothetical protein
MRGRGIGRLISGLFEGDPVSWTIFGILIAILLAYIAYVVYKSKKENSGD